MSAGGAWLSLVRASALGWIPLGERPLPNIKELVPAQESVASANDSLISALYAHNLAKVSLARALGGAEQGIQKLMEVK